MEIMEKTTKETFNLVLGAIKKQLPTATLEIIRFDQNNGEIKQSLSIKEDAHNISPCIPLAIIYGEIEKGRSVERVADYVVRIYRENARDISREDVAFLSNWEEVKERLVVRVCSGRSKFEVKRELEDLLIVPYIEFDYHDDRGVGAIRVLSRMADAWNKTAEEVIDAAIENTTKKTPFVTEDLIRVIAELQGFPISDDDPMLGQTYVVSNRDHCFGAAVLACDSVLEELAGKLEDDLVIIPSSVHEILVMRKEYAPPVEFLSQQVQEVNEEEVSPEEILSDHAYCYVRGFGIISLI